MSAFDIRSNTIRFRIDIDFPESDVDMVFNEISVLSSPLSITTCGQTNRKQKEGCVTPTDASVDRALEIVFKEIDDVSETYGLMMGTCHFWVECSIEDFQDARKKAIEKAQKIFSDTLEFYSDEEE